MFEQAKNTYQFDYSTNSKIRDIETCLSEEFDVAFGNRMGKQIDTFVSVYVAAGQGVKSTKELELEAIDYQIANKVLRKIEYKDATDTERYELLLSCLDGLPMSAKIVKKKLKEHSPLKSTNIFMMDTNYHSVYELWKILDQAECSIHHSHLWSDLARRPCW